MSKSKYFTVIDDMVWSYSRLETFNTCPYKFFLKYISEEEDKPQFYTSYGSFIHKLIEQYYNDEISKDNLWVEFVTKFKDSVKGEIPSEEIVKKYIQLGVDYFKNFQPFDFKPIAVEEMIEFKIDDINFIGFVDFVGEKDGEFYIVDNKSRDLKQRSKRKKPTKNDEEIDKMLRQLYLYSTAIKDKYGKYPKALCFHCFKNGVFIEEPFDETAYKKAIDWAKGIIEDAKETEEFYPNVDFFSCKYLCGVSDECVYDAISKGKM